MAPRRLHPVHHNSTSNHNPTYLQPGKSIPTSLSAEIAPQTIRIYYPETQLENMESAMRPRGGFVDLSVPKPDSRYKPLPGSIDPAAERVVLPRHTEEEVLMEKLGETADEEAEKNMARNAKERFSPLYELYGIDSVSHLGTEEYLQQQQAQEHGILNSMPFSHGNCSSTYHSCPFFEKYLSFHHNALLWLSLFGILYLSYRAYRSCCRRCTATARREQQSQPEERQWRAQGVNSVREENKGDRYGEKKADDVDEEEKSAGGRQEVFWLQATALDKSFHREQKYDPAIRKQLQREITCFGTEYQHGEESGDCVVNIGVEVIDNAGIEED